MKLDNSSQTIKIWYVPVRLIRYLADNLNNGYKMKLLRSSDAPYVFHRKANQLVLVIYGSGFAYLENELMVIKQGEVIYFSAGIKHAFFTNKELIIDCFHLPKDFGEDDKVYVQNNLAWKNLTVKTISERK